MFEKFMSGNRTDFRQRYEGTFGFFKHVNNKRTLAKITSVGDGECHFVNHRGLDYKLNIDSEDDVGFEFIPPKSGFFNTEQGVFLVVRVPARQFQRGISENNTRIYRLLVDIERVTFDFPLLKAIYECSNDNLIHYLEMGENNKQKCVALSSQFALDFITGCVWLFSECVGKFTLDKQLYTITLNDPTYFKIELQDCFNKLNRKVIING